MPDGQGNIKGAFFGLSVEEWERLFGTPGTPEPESEDE